MGAHPPGSETTAPKTGQYAVNRRGGSLNSGGLEGKPPGWELGRAPGGGQTVAPGGCIGADAAAGDGGPRGGTEGRGGWRVDRRIFDGSGF